MGIVKDIKDALGIGVPSRQQKGTDTFLKRAIEGQNTPGATYGNPVPTPKKKKLKPVSSRVPSTLRG